MSGTKPTKYSLPQLRFEVQANKSKKATISGVVGPFKLLLKKTYGYNDNAEVVWLLQVKVKKRHKTIGRIELTSVINDDNVAPAIAYTEIEEREYLGLGLMKLCYRILADRYGALESDASGMTSNEAKRVWLSLKAKKLRNGRFRIEGK